MSISEDMLIDRLKGHTYNMSRFQYAEVQSHIDAEMMYIITETIASFLREIEGTSYRVYTFFKVIVPAIVDVITEREKFSGSISLARIENKIWKVYYNLCTDDTSAYDMIFKMLPYIICDTLIQIRFVRD